MTSLPKFPVPAKGVTEWKVRIAGLATFLASLAGTIFLSTTATDFVKELPDWAEVIIYPSLLSVVTWLSGRAARSKPDYLSPSTVAAVERWMREKLVR